MTDNANKCRHRGFWPLVLIVAAPWVALVWLGWLA